MNRSESSTKLTPSHRPLLILTALLLLILLPVAAPAAAQEDYLPEVIPLPDGFQPEGIAINWRGVFYAGSLANGAIYRGNLVTGEGDILVEGEDGRVAVGLAYDERTDYLYVAGGPTGQARVYDAMTGENLATYQLTDAENTFVNDVVVTMSGAYFTDSARPYLYRVPVSLEGEPPAEGEFEEIELGGDYEFMEDQFNANGIDAPPGGGVVLIVNSTAGALYWVDPETGQAVQIDLGDVSLANGDGIWLKDRTVYVVQNRMNQVAVVQLDRSLTSGSLVRQITSDNFDVPTTIDDYYSHLYGVNARFGTTPEAGTQYNIVRLPE